MDGSPFDGLARQLARGGSRRRTLRLLATGIGALLVTQLKPQEAAAACQGLNQRCSTKRLKRGQGHTLGKRRLKCCRGTRCQGGKCRPNGCAAFTGLTFCAGQCVSTLTDPSNCGGCGGVCPSGSPCCGGRCTYLTNDSANCGACGNVCPLGRNGLPRSCIQSVCDTSCTPPGETCGLTETKPCCDGIPCTQNPLNIPGSTRTV